jgi:hypothetical protein
VSLLRVLRNLSVLVILTVGSLGLIPRTMAAQSSCHGVGTACTSGKQCCYYPAVACERGHCCYFIHGHICGSSVDCCSGACIDHRCN